MLSGICGGGGRGGGKARVTTMPGRDSSLPIERQMASKVSGKAQSQHDQYLSLMHDNVSRNV